ncbi:hypothetical protein C8R45DRAFT_847474 [Mycena sanguinolenta]|nr:hypothetical protein C8R45DRAFT_847474 [Mycena sanguinolenta]
MLISKRYIAALDPAAFDVLAPWFMLEPADIIPTDPRHPFNQFLIDHMDMQPSMVQSPRTQEVHDSWTILFLSKVLLNRTDVWNHPEFIALQRGLDIRIGSTTVISVSQQPPFCSTEVNAVQQIHGDNGALFLLSCMYNRTVQSVQDISSRLVWQILMRANDGTTPYYGALFRLLVLRYLDGVGHPVEVRGGLVDEEEWSKHINNSTLHASLLLHAASDTNLLPPSDTWRLKVDLHALPKSGSSHNFPSSGALV